MSSISRLFKGLCPVLLFLSANAAFAQGTLTVTPAIPDCGVTTVGTPVSCGNVTVKAVGGSVTLGVPNLQNFNGNFTLATGRPARTT